MNLFLWGALPYIAFTFLIVGTLVRFRSFHSKTSPVTRFLRELDWF